MKGRKRQQRAAAKRRRKEERYKRGGTGNSRYALKQSGQVQVTPRTQRVWCGKCYCKMCICDVNERIARARACKERDRVLRGNVRDFDYTG